MEREEQHLAPLRVFSVNFHFLGTPSFCCSSAFGTSSTSADKQWRCLRCRGRERLSTDDDVVDAVDLSHSKIITLSSGTHRVLTAILTVYYDTYNTIKTKG